MICCLVIRLTLILFRALITAPIPDTEAAALPLLGTAPVSLTMALTNALSCQPRVSKYRGGRGLGWGGGGEGICISLAPGSAALGDKVVAGGTRCHQGICT